MIKYYTDENLDIDIKVFLNTLILPTSVFAIFNSVYATFLIMLFMFIMYEFIFLDEFYNLYTKEEIVVKRNTLNLVYIVYVFFLYLFSNNIIDYLRP